MPQLQIEGIGWVDLADPVLQVIVECESAEFHEGKAAFERDVLRYTQLAVRGWLIVRVLWRDVMFWPGLVEQWLASAVQLRQAHTSTI